MALQRGMDGSLTYAGIVIDNARVINIETTRGLIPTTVKGNKHEQGTAGLVTHKATFSGLLDYVTGQQDMIDFLETATPSDTPGTLVFTVATGKTWTYTSGAVLTATRIGSPEGDNAVTFECDFHLNVQAAISWA